MASLQAKICCKRQRRRENKDHRYVPFLPDVLEKIRKKQKKIQKIKKYHYDFISAQNRLKKVVKERE